MDSPNANNTLAQIMATALETQRTCQRWLHDRGIKSPTLDPLQDPTQIPSYHIHGRPGIMQDLLSTGLPEAVAQQLSEAFDKTSEILRTMMEEKMQSTILQVFIHTTQLQGSAQAEISASNIHRMFDGLFSRKIQDLSRQAIDLAEARLSVPQGSYNRPQTKQKNSFNHVRLMNS